MKPEREEYEIILSDVYDLHQELEKCLVVKSGIRDKSLIESAVGAVLQMDAYGQFPTIFHKAARLCHGIACNHGFVDGNKRTGLFSMLTFLRVNDIKLRYTDDEMEDAIINLVEQKLTYKEFAKWLITKQV